MVNAHTTPRTMHPVPRGQRTSDPVMVRRMALRDLAVERRPYAGGFMFAVYVNGEVLREKRHHNERWFTTEDAALTAGRRARDW